MFVTKVHGKLAGEWRSCGYLRWLGTRREGRWVAFARRAEKKGESKRGILLFVRRWSRMRRAREVRSVANYERHRDGGWRENCEKVSSGWAATSMRSGF